MSFIPDDELKGRVSLNLAPMIDFLFLILMFFATLAVTRITTKDTEIKLVEIKPETSSLVTQGDADLKVVHITINAEGSYKWVTEVKDYPLASSEEIKNELLKQYQKGILPEDKTLTHVMLKIDKQAMWEPILKAIFAVREAGFDVRPVYEPEKS
jgi:biopolymer transport protein ExbD